MKIFVSSKGFAIELDLDEIRLDEALICLDKQFLEDASYE